MASTSRNYVMNSRANINRTEKQRNVEIAGKTERTKNDTQRQSQERKVLGEEIANVGNAVRIVSEGEHIVTRSVVKPFWKRYIELDEVLCSREIERMLTASGIRAVKMRRRRLDDQ